MKPHRRKIQMRQLQAIGILLLLLISFNNCSGQGFQVNSPASLSGSNSGQSDSSTTTTIPETPAPMPEKGVLRISKLSNPALTLDQGADAALMINLNYTGPALGDQYKVFIHLVSANTPDALGSLNHFPVPGPVSSAWKGNFSFAGQIVKPPAGNYIVYAGVHDQSLTSGSPNIRLTMNPGVSENFTATYGYRYQVGLLTVKATSINKNLGRLMPIGDSLTLGTTNSTTGNYMTSGYRGSLAAKLQASGFSFTYVGTEFDGTYRHEGHGGFCISTYSLCRASGSLYDQIDGWLTNNLSQPDTVLLMGGTNDLGNAPGLTPALLTDRTMALVDRILSARPQVVIFVAGTPPNTWSDRDQAFLIQANDLLAQRISARNDPRIRWANIQKAFETSPGVIRPDLSSFVPFDGTHFTPAGYELIANRWFQVLSGQ